jgi:hypothetical protein
MFVRAPFQFRHHIPMHLVSTLPIIQVTLSVGPSHLTVLLWHLRNEQRALFLVVREFGSRIRTGKNKSCVCEFVTAVGAGVVSSRFATTNTAEDEPNEEDETC